MKGDFIECCMFPLPQRKVYGAGTVPFLSTGLWRGLVNARELKARKTDGKFAC